MIKSMIKKIITALLTLNAKILLWRFKPEIIAITGSAGKTSTKEFLYKILDEDFDVLASREGYNTEIGAPLALFQEGVPDNVNSLFGWFQKVFKTFLSAITRKDFPQKVIMEMGADKPGDIHYLARQFKPKIGIILTVLPVHLAEFKSTVAIAEEKAELAKSIPTDGTLILNWDDKLVREMAVKTKGKVLFFGTKNQEGLNVNHVQSTLEGLSFRLTEDKTETDIKASLYGEHLIYPLVGAITAARAMNMSYSRIKKAIKEIRPFKGRMNVLEGINNSVIIDDSYNANPESVKKSLNFLKSQKGRRIAVLGNMNELGDYEVEGHKEVGRFSMSCCDFLITVGDNAEKYIAKEALKAGLAKGKVKSFKTSVQAGLYLRDFVQPGDVILLKGSQNNVLMENAVRQVIKEKGRAKELLVRQSEFWQKRS